MVDPKFNSPGNRFDRLFKSERSWLVKVGGAGVFGLIVAGRIVRQHWNDSPISARVSTLVAVPLFVMLLAGALVRADAVRRQMRTGGRIGPFSRFLFGAGIWSLLIWVFVALLIGFPLAIWLGSMTSERPAG